MPYLKFVNSYSNYHINVHNFAFRIFFRFMYKSNVCCKAIYRETIDYRYKYISIYMSVQKKIFLLSSAFSIFSKPQTFTINFCTDVRKRNNTTSDSNHFSSFHSSFLVSLCANQILLQIAEHLKCT